MKTLKVLKLIKREMSMLKSIKKLASKALLIGAVVSSSLITFSTAQAQQEVWLDVRTAEEYSTGHVENLSLIHI